MSRDPFLWLFCNQNIFIETGNTITDVSSPLATGCWSVLTKCYLVCPPGRSVSAGSARDQAAAPATRRPSARRQRPSRTFCLVSTPAPPNCAHMQNISRINRSLNTIKRLENGAQPAHTQSKHNIRSVCGHRRAAQSQPQLAGCPTRLPSILYLTPPEVFVFHRNSANFDPIS